MAAARQNEINESIIVVAMTTRTWPRFADAPDGVLVELAEDVFISATLYQLLPSFACWKWELPRNRMGFQEETY